MIAAFKKEYAFLSNFYPSPVVLDGDTYPSVEHAYQASKTWDRQSRIWIRFTKQAAQAKNKGQFVTLRTDWNDTLRLRIMYDLLKQKFSIPSLREKLLATGDQELVEGNWWGDDFWGVPQGPLYSGLGKNNLGKLLMKVRSEIQLQEAEKKNVEVTGQEGSTTEGIAWG